MRTTTQLDLPGAEPSEVFRLVELLDAYPTWMHLVHRVEAIEADAGRPAWWVELRARVGPFARSKRLRMVRSEHDPATGHVRFERVQRDDRDHANWILTVDVAAAVPGARVHVQLDYTGSLWTGGVLGRVLDDEIKRGRAALAALVTAEPTR